MKKIEFLTKLGLSRSAWSSWTSEKSDSYKKKLPEIADIFGVSVDYLLGNEQKKKPTVQDDELSKMLQDPEMEDIYNILVKLSPAGVQKVRDFVHFQHEQEIKQKL
jgi:transcriptional regulator with XRE-family HTH domain